MFDPADGGNGVKMGRRRLKILLGRKHIAESIPNVFLSFLLYFAINIVPTVVPEVGDLIPRKAHSICFGEVLRN